MMLTIAEVVAVHGLRGQVRVALHTDFPERLSELEHVWVRYPNGKSERQAVRGVQPHPTKALMLVKLAGVNSREAAAKLVGAMLEVEEEQAVALPEGVFFQHDIIGLKVVTTDGREIGPITDVLQTGANDVYVTGSCLIPAIADVVVSIDLAAGTMTIEPVAGLLDPEA